MKQLTSEQINFLKENAPQVIESAKKDLAVYNETRVYFEYGKFYTTPHIFVKSSYGKDYMFIGEIKREDLLTEEEIKLANEELSKCEWF